MALEDLGFPFDVLPSGYRFASAVRATAVLSAANSVMARQSQAVVVEVRVRVQQSNMRARSSATGRLVVGLPS